MDKQTIGQTISKHRKIKGLTQKALANQLNVTDKAVSKWERDVARPDINTIPKLAEILDIPVELLINIPISSKQEPKTMTTEMIAEDVKPEKLASGVVQEEADYKREIYKDNVRRLLMKGLLGFVAGFLFVVITTFADNDDFLISMALAVGFFCTGVPYGWELLGRIIGNWYVIGSIPLKVIVFAVKLIGAFLIGWCAYPIALLYNLIKAQRRGSKLKLVFSIALGLFIVLLVVLIILMTLEDSENNDHSSDSINQMQSIVEYEDTVISNTECQYVTEGLYFDVTREEYTAVCKKALDKAIADSVEDEESGYEILEPASIKAVYFLTVGESETEHYDYGDDIHMSNAIIVVTSYVVNIANMVEREEFVSWVYPNFSIDLSGSLSYDVEEEDEDYLGCENLTDVYEWMRNEYNDMLITELAIPS